jgi:hypothetical protein
MPLERHRARCHSFRASIELGDLQPETQTKEQTRDLRLFGCHDALTGGDKGQAKDPGDFSRRK